MKKISSFLLNLMVYAALLVLVSAFIATLFVVNQSEHSAIVDILPLLVSLTGIAALVLDLIYAKRAYILCISLCLIIWGLFIFFLDIGVIPFTIYQWWPLLGVTGGIICGVTGFYNYKKIKVGYAIPALTVFLMGIWFMLFSFKVIKVPFSVVAAVAGPLFMIGIIVFIFAFYLMQQKYNNLVINEEDPSDFEDDDIITE